MCGVLGIIHTENKQIDNFFLSGFDGNLSKRGPDNQGSTEFTVNSKKLKLGHTRLSILDLQDSGNQPMQSKSGRFSIIYNGEIYNHLDLRRRLEEKGTISWRGTSDTETLLAMFESQSTEEVLNSLHGMFAFCLFDKKKNELTIARDFAGEKPLYISSSSGFFAFASDLDPLKRIPGFSSTLDFEAVEYYLKLNYIPNPKTIYANSFKLPPATFLTMDLNEFELKSFKNFEDLISAKGIKYSRWFKQNESSEVFNNFELEDDELTLKRLDDLLTKSVNEQLISDVPLGAFLSGGIDSSLIVSLLQKSNQQTKTFTVGFDFLEYDETRFAKKVADYLGTDHTTYRCQEKDFFDLIPNLPNAFSEPFADSSQLPTMLVSRMARQDVKVALSGDAGDELFGGYNRYTLANKYWKYFQFSPFFIRRYLSKLLISLPDSLSTNLLNNFLDSMQLSGNRENNINKILNKLLYVRDKQTFYTSLTNEWTKEDQIMPFVKDLNSFDFMQPFKGGNDSSFEEAMMKADFLSYLPDDILCKVDRSSMFYSLETRAPFLNREVIDFAFSLPLSYKIRNGESKWILKRILSKYLPKDLFDRPKQGFGIPVSKWMRGELKDWVNDMLSDEVLNTHNLFNKKVVKKIKNDHLKGIANNEHKLWSILQFNQWYLANK